MSEIYKSSLLMTSQVKALMVITHFSAIAEESATIEKFGDAYKEYLAKTPKWIGFPKSGEA